MIYKARGIVFALMFFAASVQAGWFGPNVDAVKNELADPYSAKFENVKKLKSGAVCGEVNYKNQYGAYIGRQPFAIVGSKGYIAENSPAEVEAVCVDALDCKDTGCVVNTISDRLKALQREGLAPQLKNTNERLASLCFSRLPEKSEVQMDCLKELTTCRDNHEQGSSQHLECLISAYKKWDKAH
ncbi:hypothetical protein ACBP93_08435 [Paenalcaligenes hominis]|uniref:hypothetical protein n=1 Tax=Paenalcaligenes hominis TaxID=643674 RepID=UPI003524A387